MIRFATLFLLVLGQAAFAQTVIVKSGDHAGFTRLVLELPAPTDWEMGRTDEGYDLRLKADGVRFDLTRVFDEISRSRLAAIWMDPASGGLRLGVACACHAIPFEFRPGIIVVDVRDGPPPKGSSFELALDGAPAADLATRKMPRPRARPKGATAAAMPASVAGAYYSWLVDGRPVPPESPAVSVRAPGPVIADIHDTGPLKDALLRQLGRGAAQGIVQMAEPSLSARNAGAPLPTGPRATIHLGEVPGFDIATSRAPDHLLIKDGAECIADDRLDIATWGSDLPVSTQLSDARAHLVGEFDRPIAEAVITATKLLIHLGFGAEARQLLVQMPVKDADTVVLSSLAKLVDGAPDPHGPFAGMLTCDTAAALWAVAARPQLSPGSPAQTEAVLRAFSALPVHLRQALGPDLAAKFLAVNDLSTAQVLKNAVIRGMQSPTPAIAMLEAGIDLAGGDPVSAAARLEPVLAEAGPATAEAMIALVDAHLAAGRPILPETAIALSALVREQAGSALDPALRRAQILALASTGDFDQAFALLPQIPTAERALWELLAGSGSDAAILGHAILAPETDLPDLAAAQRHQIATKLLALGFAEAALKWVGTLVPDSDAEGRILAVTAKLMLGDAAGAFAGTEGLDGNTAAVLRAQALVALGNPAEAADAWAMAGDDGLRQRAQSWAQNWDALALNEGSNWQSAASLVRDGPLTAATDLPGPLALGNALVADSAKARSTLTDLLAAVAGPAAAE